MKTVSYGRNDDPVIVLNNGSFCSERSLVAVSENLARDFHVVVAVLDGNDGGTEPYISTAHQAEKILASLVDQGITQVAVLQGLSMGAEIALELLRQCETGEGPGCSVEIERAFFDGGPFLHLNPLMRKIMLKKFGGMVDRMSGKTEEASIASFRSNKMVRKMIGDSADGYEPMMRDMWHTSQTINGEQVKGQVATCYTCDLPAFEKASQEKMVFQWCEKEKARDCEQRVRKAYPHAGFRIVEGLGHGGMAALQPDRYADRIRVLAGK